MKTINQLNMIMKKITLVTVAGIFVTMAYGQKNSKMELKTELDSMSYSLGVSIANNLKSQGIEELNVEAMAAAMADAYGSGETKMSAQDAQMFLQNYMVEIQKKANDKYRIEGEKFLAENAKRKEVIVTESGLQYEVIKMGDGPKPGPTDKVNVHYHGTLIDGTVFDSSVERGQPISFGLNQVIKGWTEGLQHMPLGSKFKFYIPQELAYGARPQPGGAIKPYMALIFEVELFAIE